MAKRTQTGRQLEKKSCRVFTQFLKFWKVDGESCRMQASPTDSTSAAARGGVEREASQPVLPNERDTNGAPYAEKVAYSVGTVSEVTCRTSAVERKKPGLFSCRELDAVRLRVCRAWPSPAVLGWLKEGKGDTSGKPVGGKVAQGFHSICEVLKSRRPVLSNASNPDCFHPGSLTQSGSACDGPGPRPQFWVG